MLWHQMLFYKIKGLGGREVCVCVCVSYINIFIYIFQRFPWVNIQAFTFWQLL